MGYNTWESLPVKPLKDRINVVITKDHFYYLSCNQGIKKPQLILSHLKNLQLVFQMKIIKKYLLLVEQDYIKKLSTMVWILFMKLFVIIFMMR